MRVKAWLAAAMCLLLITGGALAETPKPAIEMQRSVSKEYVGAGESVVIRYRVENTGNVPLQDIVVTDGLCGKVGEESRLMPGEYRAFQVCIAVTKPCVSAPEVAWCYDGMSHSRSLEPVALAPAVNRMTVQLSADTQQARQGDTIRLTVRLINEGNTQIGDISLADDVLGDIGAIQGNLRPGEEMEHVIECRAEQTQTYRIRASARTSSDERIEAASGTVEIPVAQADTTPRLTLSACAAGDGTAQITLQNDSDVPIGPITILERTQGKLRTIACAAPGKTTLTIACGAGENQFLAQFFDGEANKSVLSETVQIVGEAESGDMLLNGPVWLGTPAYAVLMYTGLALLALFACAAAYQWAKRRRRRRRQKERRARHMRLLRKNARLSEEEWAQTRPHKAVEREDTRA